MTAKDCYDYIRTSQGANVINFFTAAKDTNKNGKIDAEEQAQADEDYSIEDALKIMTVRYAQLMNTYSKYEPITLSSNVSQRTVAAIKEKQCRHAGCGGQHRIEACLQRQQIFFSYHRLHRYDFFGNSGESQGRRS